MKYRERGGEKNCWKGQVGGVMSHHPDETDDVRPMGVKGADWRKIRASVGGKMRLKGKKSEIPPIIQEKTDLFAVSDF